MNFGWKRTALVLALAMGGVSAAQADRIKNPTAVFSGLDKITGRIVSFEVAVNETVQFGALQMTPRVCFTKPSTEAPNTTSFIEVEEAGSDGKNQKVFSGWLFASSPGLHGIEHPVYDIWLVDCKGGTEVIAEPKEMPEELPPVQPQDARRPSGIMAPETGPVPAAVQPVPPPPAVQSAPIQQPPQVRRPPPPRAPVINNNRSND